MDIIQTLINQGASSDTIRCGKPIATAAAFHEVRLSQSADYQPTEAEIQSLQDVFDQIMAEGDMPQINLLCVAFGDSERSFTGEDLYTSYFLYTPADMIKFDYSHLLMSIKALYCAPS